MNKNYNIKDENGKDLDITLIGCFKVPDLEKEYAIYSIEDNSDNGYAMIGELIKEKDTLKVQGIAEEEKSVVLAYYNEIVNKLGGDNNG